jgi:acetylglutamate kinase
MEPIENNINQNNNSPFRGLGGVLYVIKIGGNIIDDEMKLSAFIKTFASIEGKKILVHGGGKLATKLADQLGIEQQMIDGRRITDAETLKIVTMVYAGYINKNIVAKLQANNCNAIGICGADGNLIQAHKRLPLVDGGIDYGFVGDIDMVNTTLLQTILENGMSVVIAPITYNQEGDLLNTNADTVAQEIAKALGSLYKVVLIYSFEKNGVLLDVKDDSSVIENINAHKYADLKAKQLIFAGMIPKLDNAFAALQNGVSKVVIGNAEHLAEIIQNKSGTLIQLES